MQWSLSSGFVPVRSPVKREESDHWLLDIGYWLLARGRLGLGVGRNCPSNPDLGLVHPAQFIREGTMFIRQPSSSA